MEIVELGSITTEIKSLDGAQQFNWQKNELVK